MTKTTSILDNTWNEKLFIFVKTYCEVVFVNMKREVMHNIKAECEFQSEDPAQTFYGPHFIHGLQFCPG